jgi:TM2 domain-containing membrane protein YozV
MAYYPQATPPSVPYVAPGIAYTLPPKSRTTFIVLGIFLGMFGVHNFYAGYTGKAVGQLCLTILTLGYGALVAWPWAIVEICITDRDSQGTLFN